MLAGPQYKLAVEQAALYFLLTNLRYRRLWALAVEWGGEGYR